MYWARWTMGRRRRNHSLWIGISMYINKYCEAALDGNQTCPTVGTAVMSLMSAQCHKEYQINIGQLWLRLISKPPLHDAIWIVSQINWRVDNTRGITKCMFASQLLSCCASSDRIWFIVVAQHVHLYDVLPFLEDVLSDFSLMTICSVRGVSWYF